LLSLLQVSKTDSLTDRIDRLADSRTSAAAATSASANFMSPPISVSKAASALSLHPFCKTNVQDCADYIEAMHRLNDMTSCNDVKKGLLNNGKVDAMFTDAANNILCAGPSISKAAVSPAEPAKCDVEVNDVCVWRQGQGLSITFHSATEARRRGQGSFDANAGWNQQSVSQSLSYPCTPVSYECLALGRFRHRWLPLHLGKQVD
jgi:hypothetical protein